MEKSILINKLNLEVLHTQIFSSNGDNIGNYIRPANNIEDRIDRRKAYKLNKKLISLLDKEQMRVVML